VGAVPRDADATRARLIEAAIAEFARRGLAGARVDRIAAAAAANKRAIYDYYGDKEALFDAAASQVIGDLIDAVPLQEDDLPGYAARLFDYLHAHPEAVRMVTWRRLERPQAGPRIANTFVEHMGAVTDRSGVAEGQHAIGPVDLVILIIGLANAWDLSAADLLTADGQDPDAPERIAIHRAAVIEAARRISVA
jgi:AcrR family transcriptional regulator